EGKDGRPGSLGSPRPWPPPPLRFSRRLVSAPRGRRGDTPCPPFRVAPILKLLATPLARPSREKLRMVPTAAPQSRRFPLTRPAFFFLGSLFLFTCCFQPAAADAPKPVTADEVRELQAKYLAEREAAGKAGLDKKFSPDCFGRAELMAKKGDAALAAGRLL